MSTSLIPVPLPDSPVSRMALDGHLEASVDELGERIAKLSAQIQAATYHLLTMIREFDERNGWEFGFNSCAHWLNWRTGLALGPAREKVRVARALGDLPLLSQAMRTGEISYSKVRALTRIATGDNEAQLLDFAKDGSAAHIEKLVRLTRGVERRMEAEHERLRHEARYLSIRTDEDGTVLLKGRLDPEVGAVLLKAIDAAQEILFDREKEQMDRTLDCVSVPQRRADAIGLVAEAALRPSSDSPLDTRAERFQVVVHVDEQVLADPSELGRSSIEGGKDVPAETSRRLSCDAGKVIMTHDSEGNILDVGRRTSTISPALRRALNHRDETCRFPGCEVTFCDAHHIQHWAEGGETSLNNTILLCRKHHRAVHEEGFRIERRSRGNVEFYRPNGNTVPAVPLLPDPGPHPIDDLEDRLGRQGIEISNMTGYPTWEGGDIDWGLAVDSVVQN